MAKKNVPYDQKYYDDVETWPRENALGMRPA